MRRLLPKAQPCFQNHDQGEGIVWIPNDLDNETQINSVSKFSTDELIKLLSLDKTIIEMAISS